MKNKTFSLSRYLASRFQSKHLFVIILLSLSIGLFLYNLQTQNESNIKIVNSTSLREDVTVIVSIAGLFSAIGALVFNSLSQSSQNKNQYYQILKDFEGEYIKLGEIEVQLRDFVGMTFEELSRQPRETIEDVELYRWKFYQFHERIAHLALKGIIPKEIARYYVFSFGVDLFYIDIDFNPEILKQELSYTMTWCRNENIRKPSKL